MPGRGVPGQLTSRLALREGVSRRRGRIEPHPHTPTRTHAARAPIGATHASARSEECASEISRWPAGWAGQALSRSIACLMANRIDPLVGSSRFQPSLRPVCQPPGIPRGPPVSSKRSGGLEEMFLAAAAAVLSFSPDMSCRASTSGSHRVFCRWSWFGLQKSQFLHSQASLN